MQIAKDMTVSMHYTLTLDSGEVIDSSAGREPLQFICGHDQLMQTVSREQLPPDLELKEGMSLTGRNEQGQQFEVLVKSFTDSDVKIDMNHPLAGKILNFETEIVEIREVSSEELDHGHVH